MLSVLDMYSIGIGPSSSHTVGPMEASNTFITMLQQENLLRDVARIHVVLYGSLASTGAGHGTDRAVFAGLEGRRPATCNTEEVKTGLDHASEIHTMFLGRDHVIRFKRSDIEFNMNQQLNLHPNGLLYEAFDRDNNLLEHEIIYSIGGGFIATQEELEERLESTSNNMVLPSNGTTIITAEEAYAQNAAEHPFAEKIFRQTGLQAAQQAHETHQFQQKLAVSQLNYKEENLLPYHFPYEFTTMNELLQIAEQTGLSFDQIVWENETARRDEAVLNKALHRIVDVMLDCVQRGLQSTDAYLPGVLKTPRRAPLGKKKLLGTHYDIFTGDPEKLRLLNIWDDQRSHAREWTDLFAMAVSEENAAGGRIVTAPTNGSAGIIPAVLHYYMAFVPQASWSGIKKLLLTSTAIGYLFKRNASISGAENGCQAEIGSACSMAAGGLCAALGGTPRQVENAAEIGIEHNLGLTCDPIAGLVQIPCIERNAVAANTAIDAAQLALLGNGSHIVSLDAAIRTMKETGDDMLTKYKETSRGGLAVNVGIPEC